MPVTVEKRDGKYRVIEKATGQIAKNRAGTALDGGGHGTAKAAQAQASAVNISLSKKKNG